MYTSGPCRLSRAHEDGGITHSQIQQTHPLLKQVDTLPSDQQETKRKKQERKSILIVEIPLNTLIFLSLL